MQAGLAKRENADLLIVNIIGGYGLPDKAMLRLSQSEEFWLKEFLETLSAGTLTKVMKRARAAGTDKIEFESRRHRAIDRRHRHGAGGEEDPGQRHLLWAGGNAFGVGRSSLPQTARPSPSQAPEPRLITPDDVGRLSRIPSERRSERNDGQHLLCGRGIACVGLMASFLVRRAPSDPA